VIKAGQEIKKKSLTIELVSCKGRKDLRAWAKGLSVRGRLGDGDQEKHMGAKFLKRARKRVQSRNEISQEGGRRQALWA